MSDPNDVVQRRDDNITDTTAASVVDVGQPRTPKQDLWDIDDDIFKPLLERVEEERRLEEKEEAAARAHDQSERIVSHDISSNLVNWGNHDLSSTSTIEIPKINVGRRPVLSQSPGPVTIRSQQPNMPRVIWQQNGTPLKKALGFFETLNRRAQLTVAGISIFVVWNLIAILSARFASLMVFQFDPFYPRNWQMVYKLYNQGSTLQWSFVMFYMFIFVIVPLVGLMIAIKAAPELRKLINAILKPFYIIPQSIAKMVLKILGLQPSEQPVPVVQKPSYAAYNLKNYHGATFKKDKTEEDTTGGSVGGAGAGGGHGKPSWQGGPMNSQAFPRGEQGRR